MSTISVALTVSFQPDAEVVVTAAHQTDQISLTPSQLTFTTSTWNVAQTITVMAIDDIMREGNHSVLVNVTVQSEDDRFNGITVAPIQISIEDNDCDQLVAPPNGAVLAGCGNAYGDICKVQCNLGHGPGPSVAMECQSATGTWNASTPNCTACLQGYFKQNKSLM